MRLDSDQIAGFVEAFLWPRFDEPKPTPDFHRQIWKDCASDNPRVAIAAPRGHAKSSAVTHAMVLSMVLFQERDFVLIISETETQAIGFLNDIKVELKENTELIRTFGIKRFLRDTESDISVLTDHGKFRIIAKGSEQKVRGLKWRGKRPNLIIMDDGEGDEQVMNKERRLKFRKWFFNALMPAGADSCLYRVVGTVLHNDSLLERLLSDPSWVSRRYSAHGPDFSNLLWPEKFSQERLRIIRQQYASQNNLEGYSQEYLNQAIDEENAFFKREMFVPMTPLDHASLKTFYLSGDVAVSTKDVADQTVLVIAGVDTRNMIHIVDCRAGRWDSLRVIEEVFEACKQWDVAEVFMEKGIIERSLGPVFNTEMIRRNKYLSITTEHPSADKMTRARAIQARMKAGGVRFDVDSPWFEDLQDELCRFPRAKHDDHVDAMAQIGMQVDRIYAVATPEEEDEEHFQRQAHAARNEGGRSSHTGY